jgi:transposase
MRNIVNKFKETGSVEERKRSGRARSAVTPEKVQEVRNLLEKKPFTTMTIGSLELGMSKTSYHRAVRESGFRTYHPSKVIELSDDDFDRREEFCTMFLAKIDQEPGNYS